MWLLSKGYDSIHTLDLPGKNSTRDSEILTFSQKDGRIVVTKDSDFLESQFLAGPSSRNFVKEEHGAA
jgi:predicted nuclease of predicted toxin-antitoxin system